MTELLITHTFRGFALSLVSAFLPIFLLKRGYSLPEVIFFEIMLFLFLILTSYFTLNFNSNNGIKKGIVISFFFTFGFYILLINIEHIIARIGSLLSLVLLALVSIAGDSFYWMSFHLDFTRNFDSKKEGKQLGIINSVPLILTIFAPLIGGYLVSYSTFDFTFLIILIILIFAAVPLFFSKDIYLKSQFSFRNSLNLKNMRKNLLFLFEGINSGSLMFIWPVLMYLFDLNLVTIGSIIAVATSIYAISSYMSGTLTDRYSDRKVLKYGALAHGATVIGRPFFKSAFGLGFMQSLGGLTGPFLFIPVHNILYKKAKLLNPCESILNREIYLNVGRVLVLCLLLTLVMLTSAKTGFIAALVVGGIFTIAMMFFSEL